MPKKKPKPRPAPHPATPASARRWLAALALLLLSLGAFAPALQNDYVNFDDGPYILGNSQLNDWSGLLAIWTRADPTFFNPLTFTSFWLEKHLETALGIINPSQPPAASINHAINLILHGAAAALLWLCLQRLGMPATLAWLAAAIWLVHPLQVQSVVWSSERKNTLSGLLCLAATLLWLKSDGRWSKAAYWAALACFAGAML